MALSAKVGQAFYSEFGELRPAQRGAVEPVLVGRDVLVLAGTGSGKTEAVLAPLVQRYMPTMTGADGCSIVYVTPTRALANDLLRRIEPSLEFLQVSVGIRHGERSDVSNGKAPDVLITTPESLDVLLGTDVREILRSVRGVVLDEVHLIYNTQRGFQVGVLLRRLEALVGTPCQVVGLSATVASAGDIWRFLRPRREVVAIRDEQHKVLDVVIRDVPSDVQLMELANGLAEGRRAKILMFANARRECDRLGEALRGETRFGPNIYVHHSALNREMRWAAERKFHAAPKAICVATSTLELGIDIGDIDLVALYGHPGGWESFLQRVGRGNRRSSKTNVACLVSPDHGSRFRNILAFEALLSQVTSGRLERERPLDIYGAAAQQLASIVLAGGGGYARVGDLVEHFSGWGHLGPGTVEAMLDGLAESGHLVRHGFRNRFGAGEGLHRLRDQRLVWGNFPLRGRDVVVVARGREVGRVPATNLLRLGEGVVFRFGGGRWRVRRVHSEYIDVEATRSRGGVEVSYGTAGIRMDPTVWEEMLRIIAERGTCGVMNERTREYFVAGVERVRRHVGWNRVAVARDPAGRYYYFTFAGRLFNVVIAKWAGLETFDAGEIALCSERRIDLSALPGQPSALEGAASMAWEMPGELSVFQNLLPGGMLERELAEAWLKTAVYERSLARLREAEAVPVPLEDMAGLYG